MATFEVNGKQIYYEAHGTGEPLVPVSYTHLTLPTKA